MLILKNQTYDRWKFLTMIGLPAFVTFYVGLGQLWGFPETEKVGASFALFNTFLGLILRSSNKNYQNQEEDYDGEMEVNGEDDLTGHPNVALKITTDPREISEVAKFRVIKPGIHRRD